MSARIVLPVVLLLRHRHVPETVEPLASTKATAHGHRTRPGNHASLNLCVYRSVTNGLIGKTQVAS